MSLTFYLSVRSTSEPEMPPNTSSRRCSPSASQRLHCSVTEETREVAENSRSKISEGLIPEKEAGTWKTVVFNMREAVDRGDSNTSHEHPLACNLDVDDRIRRMDTSFPKHTSSPLTGPFPARGVQVNCPQSTSGTLYRDGTSFPPEVGMGRSPIGSGMENESSRRLTPMP